jgi:pyrroloquinoline quinone (PQQ) biosynthesis protein C
MLPFAVDTENDLVLRVPSALQQHAAEFAHKLQSHPFLKRCADGTITMPELRRFLVQQGKYSAHFTRFLCALISCLEQDTEVLSLAENLAEEMGLGGAHHEPHARIYSRMLKNFDIDIASEDVNPATQNLIDTMYMLCRQPGSVAGLGALCMAAEAVVPSFYARIVEGFISQGVDPSALEFFTIHIEEDDEHAATMYRILARKIAASSQNESVAVHAGELAIHARLRFLDALLEAS